MKRLFAQTLLILLVNSVSFPQTASPARTESEKAIRALLYEVSVATQTGDAKTFKKYAAQRTLKFYDLLVEELMKSPKVKEQLSRANVANGESFIDFSFRSAAQRASAIPRSKIEESAREYATAATLTFTSETEAKAETKAGTVRVVREAEMWKVDGTEGMKKALLMSLPLAPESKEKLEKF